MASSSLANGPADVGLLISILYTAEAEIWRNVGVSVRRLQPRWSSLAVCWRL